VGSLQPTGGHANSTALQCNGWYVPRASSGPRKDLAACVEHIPLAVPDTDPYLADANPCTQSAGSIRRTVRALPPVHGGSSSTSGQPIPASTEKMFWHSASLQQDCNKHTNNGNMCQMVMHPPRREKRVPLRGGPSGLRGRGSGSLGDSGWRAREAGRPRRGVSGRIAGRGT
jgi:hypothetical protein